MQKKNGAQIRIHNVKRVKGFIGKVIMSCEGTLLKCSPRRDLIINELDVVSELSSSEDGVSMEDPH
jgi:hypothetical protein